MTETFRDLYSDNPIESAEADDLQRGGFADQIAKILGEVASQDHSTVAALIGPWGSGKSSVLRLLEQ